MTKWWPCFRRFYADLVDGIAIGVRSRGDGAWIPACAGMTKGSAGMTKWGAGMTKCGGGRPAHGWGRAPALRGFLVGLQEDPGDPAGCFREVLDFVRLEGPAEDGALAVGEPLL